MVILFSRYQAMLARIFDVCILRPNSAQVPEAKHSNNQNIPLRKNQGSDHSSFFFGFETIRNRNSLEPQEDEEDDPDLLTSKPLLKLPPVIMPVYGEAEGTEDDDDDDDGDGGDDTDIYDTDYDPCSTS